VNIEKRRNIIVRVNLWIIISLSSLFFLISCESKSPSGKKPSKGQPVQVIKQADILRSQNGDVEIEIKSPIIYNYDGDSARMVFPKGVKVWFYNKDLTVKAILKANYAISYNNNNKVYLKDSIEIINYNNKDTIYCQELTWNKNLRTIISNKQVRRLSQSGIAYGDGFQSNEQMDSVHIIKLRGVQYVSDDQ
jgi:LPS export ABC transporter protein LptC